MTPFIIMHKFAASILFPFCGCVFWRCGDVYLHFLDFRFLLVEYLPWGIASSWWLSTRINIILYLKNTITCNISSVKCYHYKSWSWAREFVIWVSIPPTKTFAFSNIVCINTSISGIIIWTTSNPQYVKQVAYCWHVLFRCMSS